MRFICGSILSPQHKDFGGLSGSGIEDFLLCWILLCVSASSRETWNAIKSKGTQKSQIAKHQCLKLLYPEVFEIVFTVITIVGILCDCVRAIKQLLCGKESQPFFSKANRLTIPRLQRQGRE